MQQASREIEPAIRETLKQLRNIDKHKHEGLFAKPVVKEFKNIADEYIKVIENPMDLKTLTDRTKKPLVPGGLWTWADWQVPLLLAVGACCAYTSMTTMASVSFCHNAKCLLPIRVGCMQAFTGSSETCL